MQKNLLKQKKSTVNLKKVPVLTLPENWWNKNNSYNYLSEEANSQVHLFKIDLNGNEKTEEELKAEKQQIARKWDYSKGDYFIHQSNFKNIVNNQKRNNKIFDKFLYIALAVSVIVAWVILSFVSKM